MSIEKLDDVAFCGDGRDGDSPVKLLQFKHHISRKGGLSDKSEDVWKTIRIWADLALAKKIDLDQIVLLMVTTSVSNRRNAVHFLLPDSKERDIDEALRRLQDAGKDSQSATVKDAYSTFARLSAAQRRKLVGAIHLIEGSPTILDLRGKIETALRHAVRPQHRKAFVDRLEGWWFRIVIEHLMSSSSDSTVAIGKIHQHIHDLGEQFRREALPDDLLQATIPNDAVREDDNRMFIRQLNLIHIVNNRIRTAQEDHYRAFTQRSRWVRDRLIELDEVDKFEARLADEWRHKFEIMQDGITKDTDQSRLSAGKAVYNWTQDTAPANTSLFIRPQFQTPYMVRGSYHMLADVLRVGWHPHFQAHLCSEETAEKEGTDAKGMD
ncbi:MAG TPA: ABC-three component system protein [Thermoguttaceae bacterium]|nr:ABC-three component system protein [Thermoguttaceae bacterium]